MNEDKRGITPADVTAITLERLNAGPGQNWRVTIEQGNGDAVKLLELTDMERIQLALMLESELCAHVSFLDFTRKQETA